MAGKVYLQQSPISNEHFGSAQYSLFDIIFDQMS